MTDPMRPRRTRLRTPLNGFTFAAAFALVIANVAPCHAQDADAYDPLDTMTDRNPQLKFEKLDKERIVTRRIDLVDDDGIVRLTLGAPLPNPIIDGIEYSRSRPVNGLMLRDEKGNERGGIAFLDGLNWPAIILDHEASEAAGLIVRKDGSMQFLMIQPGAQKRDPRVDNRVVPSGGGPTRLALSVPASGAPAVELNDENSRPRIRMTLTKEGYGSLEFLSADGKVVRAITPEAESAAGSGG